MNNGRRMPDTPWHIGYAKKDEDDPRRDKRRCVYYASGHCQYRKERCFGSSHCGNYSEVRRYFIAERDQERTAEALRKERIERYKSTLELEKNKLDRSRNNSSRYIRSENLKKCMVCGDALETRFLSLRCCRYCGMFYVNAEDYCDERVLGILCSSPVFIMGQEKK